MGILKTRMLREKWTAESGQQASEESKDCTGNWAGGHSCDIRANDLAACCLCATNLKDTEHRSDRLICLVEEEKKSIQVTARLRLIALIQVHSEGDHGMSAKESCRCEVEPAQ